MELKFPEQSITTKFEIGDRVVYKNLVEGGRITGTISAIQVSNRAILTYVSDELKVIHPQVAIFYMILSDVPRGYYANDYFGSAPENDLLALEEEE